MCSLVTLSKDYSTKSKTLLAESFGQRLLIISTVLLPFYVEQPHDKSSALYKHPTSCCKNNLERLTDPSVINFNKVFILYLYIGYLLVQIFTLINKLFESNLSSSITFFSVAVVFIWSAIPFAGYALAKLFKAKGCMSKYLLLMIGISVGVIEIGLFYFDILSQKQHAIGTAIVFALFFITAFISTGNVEFTRQTEKNELK